MQLALTILTFVPKGKPILGKRLPHLLQTLAKTDFPGSVVVVDDASRDPKHVAYLKSLKEKYGIRLVRRKKRGGISKAKNTCLRVLANSGFDFGFLMEDDMSLSENWWAPYVRVHKRTGIHHFSWASDNYFSNMRKRTVQHKLIPVAKCSRLNGCMLTVTPKQIERVGGFKVLPRVWGFEHINYTRRCVAAKLAPFSVDVVKSNKYMRLGPFSRISFINHAQRVASNNANRSLASSTKRYEPIRE